MALLTIETGASNPILRTQTTVVPQVTKDILKLLKDMEETVISVEGLGIAAPQVGSTHRLCIVKIADTYIPLINPNITTRSEDTDSLEEGCLSLPGIEVSVSRPLSISLTFIDKRGDIQERSYAGLPARIIQHEVDHLNGVLIVDYETSI